MRRHHWQLQATLELPCLALALAHVCRSAQCVRGSCRAATRGQSAFLLSEPRTVSALQIRSFECPFALSSLQPFTMATAEIIWSVTRKSNAFRVKRNGLDLSREPVNVTNKHSYKTSGFVQKSLSVAASADDKKISVVLPSTKYAAAPAKAIHSVGVSNNVAKGNKTVNAVAWKIAGRPDLRNAALARATRLHKVKVGSKVYKLRQHTRRTQA